MTETTAITNPAAEPQPPLTIGDFADRLDDLVGDLASAAWAVDGAICASQPDQGHMLALALRALRSLGADAERLVVAAGGRRSGWFDDAQPTTEGVQ